MKRRGVHDVFHSALLRIHHPNDDRLFPGRLDSQISNEIDPEGEWAVDSILSHHGSREDALFEIKWRSGDITWMPYYQIVGLQALVSYFEVLGINSVSELTTGKGKPPSSDPQVFLGAIQFTSESVTAKNYNLASFRQFVPQFPSLPSFRSHFYHGQITITLVQTLFYPLGFVDSCGIAYRIPSIHQPHLRHSLYRYRHLCVACPTLHLSGSGYSSPV
jgi:hypothetical protein